MAMDKQEIVAALRRELEAVSTQRRSARADTKTLAALQALKRFQSQRMATTHADLLAADDTRDAAQFFLSDLYGTRDMTRRDADIGRVVPMMERLLPAPALHTIMQAIALDALSERLDAAMAARLGEQFGEVDYARAYREVTRRDEREMQLQHVQALGEALVHLAAMPLLGGTLEMMRGPARIARLSALQQFLETGFRAFRKIQVPQAFVSTVITREKTILENLYAGRPRPFHV